MVLNDTILSDMARNGEKFFLPVAAISAAAVSLKDKYYRDKHCPCKKDFVQLSFGTDEHTDKHPVTFV